MTTPARATDIVFTRHGARRGLAWLAEAYRMFREARLPWVILLALYYLLMVLLSVVPYVSHVLPALVKPVFAVGLLAAAWTQERGGRPSLSHLFQGFRANLQALLALGVMLVVGVIAAVLATSLFDGGLLVDLLSREQPLATPETVDKERSTPADELVKVGKLQGSLLVAALLAMPTILALWFAPALVVFQDAGPATALGASLRAALANWRPLLVYALAVLLFGALLPIIVAQFVVMLLPSQTTIWIVFVGYLGYALMFFATLHISDYVSYRDIFHAGETLAPLTPGSRGDESS
jgi:uncharacterized membrane protein